MPYKTRSLLLSSQNPWPPPLPKTGTSYWTRLFFINSDRYNVRHRPQQTWRDQLKADHKFAVTATATTTTAERQQQVHFRRALRQPTDATPPGLRCCHGCQWYQSGLQVDGRRQKRKAKVSALLPVPCLQKKVRQKKMDDSIRECYLKWPIFVDLVFCKNAKLHVISTICEFAFTPSDSKCGQCTLVHFLLQGFYCFNAKGFLHI